MSASGSKSSLEVPAPRRSRAVSISVDHSILQQQVLEEMQQQGGAHSIEVELTYFFMDFGLPKFYFNHTDPAAIAKHILSLQAAKQLARLSEKPFDIQLNLASAHSAFFATTSNISTAAGHPKRLGANNDTCQVVSLERHIEAVYLSGSAAQDMDSMGTPPESLSFAASTPEDAKGVVHRLQCFRSRGPIEPGSQVHLRLYFLQAPEFEHPDCAPDEWDIERIGDARFLSHTDSHVLDLYQNVVKEAVENFGPAIHVHPNFNNKEEHLLLVAFRNGSTHSYFTGIAMVYRHHNMFATHKFVTPMANGMVVYAFFLRPLDSNPSDIADRLQHICRDVCMHYVLPRTSLTPLISEQNMSVEEVAYLYSAWKFAFHFIEKGLQEVDQLSNLFKDHPEANALLQRIKSNISGHAFTEGVILSELLSNPGLLKLMYRDFASMHRPDNSTGSPPLPQKLEEATAQLAKLCKADRAISIFSAILSFNRNIVKTNFYKSNKVALSFRLKPDFLNASSHPHRPYGIFFIVGAEFRAFHVRFHDVARGGIRIVRSRFVQDYVNNLAGLFDEAYNLASTQQRKNKDIPEGGSKGVILLNSAHQDKASVAFEKFVDSLMDLLLPDPQVLDRHGRPEILFLGPDEGTANLMDWASLHARSRGYSHWKAFTTGKSVKFGGIPHDKFGMTTNSVRAYVEGIQAKLGLNAEQCTKVQTGGPDGDLGSNEIKMGKERTTCIIDGSGVLFDPKGINREELLRLAGKRIMANNFDTSKLSKEGFFVSVDEKDRILPDGTVVASGLENRNLFHFSPLVRADFFVPCGGRPASVPESRVLDFIYGMGHDDEVSGLPRFRYVVEGANLFFTPGARLQLEKHGIIIFKDASANKGGVTSSSLEVLAALALSDQEFAQHMQVTDTANPPAFYMQYVAQVQQKIKENATLEFECLWREGENGTSRCHLSDVLSAKITDLSANIEKSDALCSPGSPLWHRVLRACMPPVLTETVGFEAILSRLPDAYKRALFASHLASRFIYQYGLNTPEFAFYEFVNRMLAN